MSPDSSHAVFGTGRPMPAAGPTPCEEAQGAQAAPRRTPIDNLLTSRDIHGIEKFHVSGGVERAAQALQFAERVMIVTGYNAGPGMPITDGPPGAVALANALVRLGKEVTLVTDSKIIPMLRAGYDVLDPQEENLTYLRFDYDRGNNAVNEKAHQLLADRKPDVVIGVGVPSRTAHNEVKCPQGTDIAPFNHALDQILITARNRVGTTTIGIGSSGTEAGLGGIPGVPLDRHEKDKASAVRSSIPVTAWNSNLGAVAISAVLLQLAGYHEHEIRGDEMRRILNACFEHGAVDRVTDKGKMDEAVRGGYITGVEGYSSDVHGRDLEALYEIVGSHVEPRQFVIGLMDSSNGGLVASNGLRRHLGKEFAEVTRFLYALDHGQETYGEKDCRELRDLVGRALQSLKACKPDVIVMVCNTACTVLKDILEGFGITVIDLIEETTAGMLMNAGPAHHSRPALFATAATVREHVYLNRLDEMRSTITDGSAPDIALQEIACPEWAKLVNQLKHLSDDPDDIAEVKAAVKLYVDQLHPDTTSVWLCCTHYPALEEVIRQALTERGMADVEIVDPMVYQAAATTRALRRVSTADQSDRIRSKRPLIMTTGRMETVKESADALLDLRQGRDAPPLVLATRQFGDDHDVALVADLLFRHEKYVGWPDSVAMAH